MDGELTVDEAFHKRIMDSLNSHTIAPALSDLLLVHEERIAQEMHRLKGENITVTSFELVITYFNQTDLSVRQSSQIINHVGMIGSNFLIDINADGLPDIVTIANDEIKKNPYVVNSMSPQQLFDGSSIQVRFNRGGYFDSDVHTTVLTTPYSDSFTGYQFADVNGDGEIDLVISHGHHKSLLDVYLGNGRGGFTKHANSFNIGHHIDLSQDKIQSLRFEDRNADGQPDLFVEYGRDFKSRIFYAPSNLPEGSITKITDEFGGEVNISYKWKKDFPQAVINSNRSYENGIPNVGSSLLVEKITQKNSNTAPTIESRYNYANQRFKPGTRDTAANFGFETVTESQYVNGTLKSTTVAHYSQNINFAGMMDWQEVRDAGGNLIQRVEQQYVRVNPTAHSRTVLPTRSLVLVYKNGTQIDSKETLTEYNPSFAYNPSKVTEIWNGRTTVKEITYTAQPSVGILALPSEEKVLIDGELVSHSQNTFDEGKLISKSNLVAPGKWYTEYYSYDSIGNIVFQSNNLGRNLQYTYGGTTGSLPIEVRNPLGQTTTTTYDPLTDQELSVVDPNGIETTTTYDALGRPISVYLEGTKVQSINYEWTGTKYTTTTTLHSREGDSWSKTITDKDGNELKSESLVFNNITSTRETEYDALGRVHRTSHEYLTGESPTWTTTTYYSQAEDIEERPKRITSNTGEVSELSYTATTTHITVSKDGEMLRSEILENDAFGQLIKKTVQDKAIEYTYNNKGQLIQVKDPGTGLTTMEYDLAGNKVKQTDQNSGITSYTYNIAGELLSQTDARGITQTFNLDALGRITKIQTNTPEPPTIFTYDTTNSLNTGNTIGKLTKISDASGITELAYDHRGNSIIEKRMVDDLTLLFQRTYDDLNRVKTLVYPEGTKLTHMYTPSGKLLSILMDSHDGSSRNHPVVTYTGPIQKEGKIYLQRKTGNKVETDIEVDPLYRRPKSIQTKLSDGHVEQKVSYQYDKKGNITKVTDHFHEDRNQEFTYDAVNRITTAKGKYGEETYTYHKNGNLLKRGQFNLQYNNPNHIHAVSRADSPQTGLINYQYDSIGNLIQRNGDQYSYNAQGKLKEITTEGGDKFTYTYDHSGNRIKKHLQNANTTTYAFGDLYEIHRAPGEPEKHTMYITGLQGDKVSQYSRPENPCPSSSVRWPNRVCQKPAVSGTPYTVSYLIDLICHKKLFFLYLEILKNFFDTIIHLYPQPRSETPPSLASKPRMACFGSWCTDVSICRQERVGRTYGEILRTDSYGPDISKYKYTGQEEDKESGLYYYKARYYDPVIGRFAQADSMAFPDRIQGMNRMMYVEGNPMKYGDNSGNRISTALAWGLMGAAWATQNGRSAEEGFALGYMHGRGLQKQKNNNDLDKTLGTGNLFKGIVKGDIGRFFTRTWIDLRRTPWDTRGRKRQKINDRFEVRNIACAAYFGFGTPDFAVCYVRSQIQRGRERRHVNGGDRRRMQYAEVVVQDEVANVVTCNFTDPGQHEESQFCEDDPNNPANQEEEDDDDN